MSDSVSKAELLKKIDQCLLQDRFFFASQLKKLKDTNTQQLQTIAQKMVTSMAVVHHREQQVSEISYPDLPVSRNKEEILKAIQSNQVVIVAGETGSGKTTQLPKICLEAGLGRVGLIGHTQPRRLAARSVASRIAEELDSELGSKVGFKIRFSDQVSDNTLIKLMTDGILLAEIQEDKFLNKYEVIIIDEAHERSLNIDFILGYLKTLLPKRPELKVIITSATIDPERFSKHFDDAPMIKVEGRTYPVEVRYRPLHDESKGEAKEQTEAILDAVHELGKEGSGDILVFLSGEREIRDTAEYLNNAKLRNTEVLPLYARLSASEQNRIFQSHGGRRVVLSTNVAETSLTVPGIRYVIDTGLARISRFSIRSKVQRLPIEPISQASANQRSGRCGRVADGICIRLYDEQDYLQRPEFTDPEILRTNLASVILQLTSLRMGNVDSFPFVQPPDSKNISAGIKLLEELQAIRTQKGQLRLTQPGREMARLPVDPRFARMVVAAKELNCLMEVIIITAGLSIQDPRERPKEKQQKADEIHKQWHDEDSDFSGYLKLWYGFKEQQKALSGNQLRRWCREQFLNYLRLREWQDIVSQLKQSAAQLGWRVSQHEADADNVHQSLLVGLLSHVGLLDKNREYQGARNNRFLVFPGSPLAKKSPKWIVASELVETSKLFARTVARINPNWLESAGQHLCKYRYAEPHWSKKAGACKAAEFVTMLGLPIVNQRSVIYSNIDPVVSRELFIREALVNGQTKLEYGFLNKNWRLISDVELMEDKIRRKDILIEEDDLFGFYDELLPNDICSEAGFKKWWRRVDSDEKNKWVFSKEQLIKEGASQVTELDFPNVWKQNNLQLPLEYKFEPGSIDDGVSLIVPLPVLNQIEESGFDWLVPGLREELAISLIKGLPKSLRRNFVPAPDYAKAAINAISPEEGVFLDAFAKKLTKMTGRIVEIEPFEAISVPEHLRFNFKVMEGDQCVAQGRDLNALKIQLKSKLKTALKQVAKPELEQENLQQWSFGELPESWRESQSQFAVVAYPALVQDGKKVHLRLFDSDSSAKSQHRMGLAQFIMNHLPSPTKYLHEKLPNKAKLGLYFNPFGQIQMLVNDIIQAVVLHTIDQQQSAIRNEQEFESVKEEIRSSLNDEVLAAAKIIERGLTRAHEVTKKLKGSTPLNLINAYAAAKTHLDSLVFKGFVTDVGIARLKDWERYIEALVRRVEKIPIDPNKDRLNQATLDKISELFQSKLNKVPKNQSVPEELIEVRWQIEELKVSLFAQQLGTSMPISSKRIENYLDKF